MFKPEYKDWPMAHRRLMGIFVAVLAVWGLLFWLLVSPKWLLYKKTMREHDALAKKTKKIAWPQDASLLRKQLEQCQNELNGAQETTGLKTLEKEVMAKATSTFNAEIAAAYAAPTLNESIRIFTENASRIDYKFIASQLEAELIKRNCHLPPQLMTIEENAETPIYQKVLHIWTLRLVIEKAYAQELELVADGQGGNCAVSLLPTISYKLFQKEKKPYLQEFPVQLKLRGTIDAFLKFAASLQQSDCFVPMKQMSVSSLPPEDVSLGHDVSVASQEFCVVCTSLFQPPRSEAQREKQQDER